MVGTDLGCGESRVVCGRRPVHHRSTVDGRLGVDGRGVDAGTGY